MFFPIVPYISLIYPQYLPHYNVVVSNLFSIIPASLEANFEPRLIANPVRSNPLLLRRSDNAVVEIRTVKDLKLECLGQTIARFGNLQNQKLGLDNHQIVQEGPTFEGWGH